MGGNHVAVGCIVESFYLFGDGISGWLLWSFVLHYKHTIWITIATRGEILEELSKPWNLMSLKFKPKNYWRNPSIKPHQKRSTIEQ